MRMTIFYWEKCYVGMIWVTGTIKNLGFGLFVDKDGKSVGGNLGTRLEMSGKVWSAVTNIKTNRAFQDISVERFLRFTFSAFCFNNKRKSNAILMDVT